MTPKGFSYSFSWTEHQRDTSGYGPAELDAVQTSVEIVRLDTIDKIVDEMTTFPQIEALLNDY